MDLEERFWSKVKIGKKNECWEWQSGSRGEGYGAFKYNSQVIDSHRMVWFLTYGEFPELWVLHSCDNRKCCNPSHLFLGTYLDNIKDMIKKGRMVVPTKKAFGEDTGSSILTNKEVIEIRKLLKSGKYTHKVIGEMYGVARVTITGINTNKAWNKVTE